MYLVIYPYGTTYALLKGDLVIGYLDPQGQIRVQIRGQPALVLIPTRAWSLSTIYPKGLGFKV